MTALKAHVKNGRIVVDEPVDLPEGAEVSVYLYDAAADDLTPHERAALARSLERGLAQATQATSSMPTWCSPSSSGLED